jgi:hypothetical protein
MTGCDSTSVLFRRGKKFAFTQLRDNVELQKVADVFNDHISNSEDVAVAGETFVMSMYSPTRGSIEVKREDI